MADDAILNVFEIEADGRTRHVLALVNPVLAGARGLPEHAVVGSFTPGPDGGFDPETFEVNPAFLAAVEAYMNTLPARSPEMAEHARECPGEWLYVLDPRFEGDHKDTPPPGAEILGAFAVDDAGQIAPNSFQYNAHHLWFTPETGPSGLLEDRRFYAWLHPDLSAEGAVRNLHPTEPPPT